MCRHGNMLHIINDRKHLALVLVTRQLYAELLDQLVHSIIHSLGQAALDVWVIVWASCHDICLSVSRSVRLSVSTSVCQSVRQAVSQCDQLGHCQSVICCCRTEAGSVRCLLMSGFVTMDGKRKLPNAKVRSHFKCLIRFTV